MLGDIQFITEHKHTLSKFTSLAAHTRVNQPIPYFIKEVLSPCQLRLTLFFPVLFLPLSLIFKQCSLIILFTLIPISLLLISMIFQKCSLIILFTLIPIYLLLISMTFQKCILIRATLIVACAPNLN